MGRARPYRTTMVYASPSDRQWAVTSAPGVLACVLPTAPLTLGRLTCVFWLAMAGGQPARRESKEGKQEGEEGEAEER